ncbi:MAG TPA: SIS domain-containing protein [Solirubrobacteraceae bacterium]|nr:SIS domain-containing protein [Solirubrobacteraceae bacterium]
MAERPDWHTDEFPELRSGPPWVTEEMVAAQPGLAREMLSSPPDGLDDLATAIRSSGEPVTVVGCGTSEHGALAIAWLVGEALAGDRPAWPPAIEARQSLDAVERPQQGGVCIGISHDGGTHATTLALEAAAANGATTALITNRPGGSASGPAQRVIVTPRHDDSWCHTVAYTSSILVGALLARELGGEGIDADRAASLLEVALERPPAAAAITGADRIICTGFGLDFITARELALKLAEGARVPSGALQLESLLHGHLAGEDPNTAVVLIESDPAVDRVERRAAMAAEALDAIGIPVLTLLPPEGVPGSAARLLAGAAQLHRLTLALAAHRGVNPDLIRREEEPYRRAGFAGEGSDW